MLRTATGRDVSLSGGNFSGKKTSRRFSFKDSKSDPSAFKPKLGALAGTRLRTGEVSVGAINTWFAIKTFVRPIQPIPLVAFGSGCLPSSDEFFCPYVARPAALSFASLSRRQTKKSSKNFLKAHKNRATLPSLQHQQNALCRHCFHIVV